MAQCVLRPLNCTITNRCTLCLVSVFKEKPLHPPSQAQASIQSRPTAEYSYMQSILRLLHNVNFLLLMVTYGKVWPFFLCSYHCFSLPLCALLGQKLAWVVLGEHKDSSPCCHRAGIPIARYSSAVVTSKCCREEWKEGKHTEDDMPLQLFSQSLTAVQGISLSVLFF